LVPNFSGSDQKIEFFLIKSIQGRVLLYHRSQKRVKGIYQEKVKKKIYYGFARILVPKSSILAIIVGAGQKMKALDRKSQNAQRTRYS